MANQKDIRRKIKAIQNIKKVTKAMEAISNIKLQKAMKAVSYSRKYAEELSSFAKSVSSSINLSELDICKSNKEAACAVFIVLSSDKGLCGYFHSKLFASVLKAAHEKELKGKKVILITSGKKAFDFFNRKGFEIIHSSSVSDHVNNIAAADKVLSKSADMFFKGTCESVEIFFNYFASLGRQEATSVTLFPFAPESLGNSEASNASGARPDYIFEPNQEELALGLLTQYLATRLVLCFTESTASEHAARMIAMQQATINADDMIMSLTMLYNKVRQASITREIIEVVSSAEALK